MTDELGTVVEDDLPPGDVIAGEGVSIEDEMRDTIARLEADERGETPPPDDKPDAPAVERARGPDGKFLKATDAPVAAATPAPAADAAFADKGPPATWRPGGKAAWDGLPEAAKAEIYRREQSIFDGIEQYKGKAQVADTLMQVIQPYQSLIAAAGTNVPGALAEVLRTAATFYVGTPTQKAAALRAIARTHGIDLGAAAANTGSPNAYVDPIAEQLHGRIAQLEGVLANQQRAAQNSELSAAASQIVQFRDDPQHRYFADVSYQMGQLMNAGLATNLQEAYAKACELNPNVKAAIAAQSAAAQNEERAKRVRDARRAGSLGFRSSPAPAPLGRPNGNWEESLHDAYQQIVGA
jgi:hypothetical protein